jgi:DNA polymerase III subunit delta
MYQRDFERLLQQRLPQAVLLYGENHYLIDHYINHYIQDLQAKESLLGLYFDEWDFDRARAYLAESSLFGGANLLVVRHEKKLPKKELDTLIELTVKNPDNHFIFGFYGQDRDAKSMQASFADKKGGIWVRLFELAPREAVSMLQQKAQAIGLQIDHYALDHLLRVLNQNLALCVNELEKLAIPGTPISGKDIDRLIYSTAPLAMDQLLIELFNKKPITEMISTLLDLGEDEASLLRSTQRFVNEIFLFHAYIKLHGRPNSKEILGYQLPQHVEKKRAELALRIKPATLLKIYEHLLQSELSIKQPNGMNKEAQLYAILIKLQQLL